MMTRLVDAMRDMGVRGDISPSGRWIRLHSERGAVYVVEAAWSGDYYTWCDDPSDHGIELYREPAAAIQAGLDRLAHAEVPKGEPYSQDEKAPAAVRRTCDACGAALDTDAAAYAMRWGDACFCVDCWRTLPEDEIARVAQAIALRGVPLS